MNFQQKAELAANKYIDDAMESGLKHKKWAMRQVLEMVYLCGAVDAMEDCMIKDDPPQDVDDSRRLMHDVNMWRTK